MLKAGMIIAERYEVLGKIGTGGMADVYKAKDHKLNRFVAVKVLKPEFREDKTFIRKFRSEAQAAAGLTHPNIVNVFDVGEDEGIYYIVMELIEGITLKEYIAKKGKLSIKEATSIAIQVSMGLEAAHSHGIVHRDVKPQNIIISTDGKVKVTDFGIARAASSNTISSNVMGSVHYSSPEQVRGGYSDEKSDIYSLGITLYEMVTGRVPFDGDTTVAIAIKHLQEEMVPPSVYTENLPYSLEQIIFKCTQKSVGRRYENMSDMIADLKHSLIDPQGDFVQLNNVNTDAKTVVISDEELGEIKHTQKSRNAQKKPEVAQLEEEEYETDYDDGDEDEEYERRRAAARRKQKSKKRRNQSRAVTIIALLAGAAILVAVVVFVVKTAGIFDKTEEPQQNQQVSDTEDGMVQVPDLVGKTEEEAKALVEAVNLGKQMVGEEASDQEKGKISSQDIPAGTEVEAYTTLKYYISKGPEELTIPSYDESTTAYSLQKSMEDMGLTVSVQKEYSLDTDDTDGMDWPDVEPGYIISVSPESGSVVNSGDTVTLTVSRGFDHGDSVEMPDVSGMTEEEAVTRLGKWSDVQVTEEQSADIPEGQVISQSPEAYSYVNPDETATIVISSGDEAPSTEDSAASDETETQTTADSAAQQQAAANGEIWKCTQSLNTPQGYGGGPLRLELLQDVSGTSQATTIVDGQILTFPYKLDITGAPGVSQGTLCVYEMINKEYQQLGSYPLTFEKAE